LLSLDDLFTGVGWKRNEWKEKFLLKKERTDGGIDYS
jgi:hypothetical protein